MAAGAALGDPAQSAQADALFDAGRAALEKGDYETACTKLRASREIERAPGTAYHLADCEEHRNKLATALMLFQESAKGLPRDDARLPAVRARIESLEKRVPRLTVRLGPGSPVGTDVEREGVGMVTGQAVPVDPGRHTLVASAAGLRDQVLTIEIAEGQSKEVTMTPQPAPVLGAAPGANAPAASRRPTPPQVAPSKQTTAGIVIGSVGLVAMAAGVAVGLVAKSEHDGSKAHCDKSDHCDADGIAIRDSARTKGVAATAIFGVGTGLLATGAVVWLTAPSGAAKERARPAAGSSNDKPKTSFAIGIGPSGIAAKGTW